MRAEQTPTAPPDFIVIEGPIGVGKTSLAHRLAEYFGRQTLLECAEDNPFLEHFYRDADAAAFPAQLHFLFQRSRQLETLQQRELFSDGLVADFMFAKDRLFAQLNLGKAELALYEEVYSRLSMDAPVPDLVVYLQAPVDVLLQRIRRRARPQESTLSADYLARVNGAYTRFFYRYDDAPVLIVNAESINPIDNDSDFNALVEHIRRPRPGRSYFNPSPLAIN